MGYLRFFVGVVLTILIGGCSFPMPAMPPPIGERDGVRYYADNDINITLDTASLQVRRTVEAWGKTMDDVRGLSIAYTSRHFQCQGNPNTNGCYQWGAMGEPIITVFVNNVDCPYISPIAHELWHHLFSPGAEPNAKEIIEIDLVQQRALLEITPYYCP